MNRTRTRFPLATATAALVGTAFLVSACAAGGDSATLQVHPNHAAGRSGAMLAQDVVVVVDPTTGAAQLTGTVINSGTEVDQLTSATIGDKAVTVASPVTVGAKSAVNLASAKGVKLVLPAATAAQSVKPGGTSAVDLTFANGGVVNVVAAVEPNTGIYDGYEPSTAS